MNFPLILNLTRQDFTERYAGSIFGFFWAFLHPLALISIYLVVFSKIMGSRLPGNSEMENFSIYLVSGLLPWVAFSNTLIRTTTVFQDKKNIISKIKINLSTLPCYITLSESVTFFISFSIFLFYYFFLVKLELNLIQLFCLFLLILFQQLLAFSLGLFFAILNIFFRDTKEFVAIFVNIWFWLTPIVWVPSIAPKWLMEIQDNFNPAYWLISSYRDLFVYSEIIELNHFFLIVLCVVITLSFSIVSLKFFEKDIRDFM
ncbi:MAG: ABC transporter permease [Betaproteobacteria bacterium TMED156]|nr:MAG: ABC transporter permease [Betaproteobacteria bacterium TMED156]|tara:strand:+ start:246 stop:1022 length:777 start_codon:yes stop_codon:yes gene_type:complete